MHPGMKSALRQVVPFEAGHEKLVSVSSRSRQDVMIRQFTHHITEFD